MRETEDKPFAQPVTTPAPAPAKIWIEPTLAVLPVKHAETSFGGSGHEFGVYS